MISHHDNRIFDTNATVSVSSSHQRGLNNGLPHLSLTARSSRSHSSTGTWQRNALFAIVAFALVFFFFIHSMHESPNSASMPVVRPGKQLESFGAGDVVSKAVPHLHYYSSFTPSAHGFKYYRDIVMAVSESDPLSTMQRSTGSAKGSVAGERVDRACSISDFSIRAELSLPDPDAKATVPMLLDAYMEDSNRYLDMCPSNRKDPTTGVWAAIVGALEVVLGPLHDRSGAVLPLELLHAMFPPVQRSSSVDTAGLRECSPSILIRYCESLKDRVDGESESEPEPDGGSVDADANANADDGDNNISSNSRLNGADVELSGNATVDLSDMLVVLTACNELNITLTSLDYMQRAFSNERIGSNHYVVIEKPPAVLIVDDHSSDNTTNILRAQGYFVVRTEQARGVTYGWNLGYKIAKLLGRYKSIVFMNNDVLMPKGSLELLHAALKSHAVVVPTTSAKGAGHNPKQALSRVIPALIQGSAKSHARYHRLDFYMTNPLAAQHIQDTLLRMRTRRLLSMYRSGNLEELRRPDFTIVSTQTRRHGESIGRFNGFMFGVNLADVSRYGLAHDNSKYNLFDPKALMVGQENKLAYRMTKKGLYPVIEPYAFMFHFKSMTLKVFGVNAKEEVVHNNKTSTVDVRNNVEFYHSTKQNHSVYESVEMMHVYPPFDTRGHTGAHVSGSAVKVDLHESQNACECKLSCPPVVAFAGIQSHSHCSSVKSVLRSVKRAPKHKTKYKPKASVCVGIRSPPPGRRQRRIRNVMYSFLDMYGKSAYASRLKLRLFVSQSASDNTLFRPENSTAYDAVPAKKGNVSAPLYSETLKKAVDVMNANAALRTKLPFPFAQIVRPQYMEYFNRSRFSRYYNRFYGSYMADLLIEHMLNTAPKFDVHCDWVMITDGDVIVDPAWFNNISAVILDSIGSHKLSPGVTNKKKIVDIIGWKIAKKNGAVEIPFTANEKFAMNIGSMLIRRHLFQIPYSDLCMMTPLDILGSSEPLPVCEYKTVKFLPDSIMSGEFLTRDFFTLRSLIRNSIRLIHSAYDADHTELPLNGTAATLTVKKLTDGLVILPQILSKIPGN